MSNPIDTRTLRRQACLDGQLSVEEVILFQAELTAFELREYEQEAAFEKALGDCLRTGDDIVCPDALLRDLKGRILRQDAEGAAAAAVVGHPPHRALWIFQAVAAAAAIVIIAALLGRGFVPGRADGGTGRTVAVALVDNADSFAAQAEVRGGLEVIRAALAEGGFGDVTIQTPQANAHHGVSFLGYRRESVNGRPALRLYVTCCNRPASVVIAAGEAPFEFAAVGRPAGWYEASKAVGKNHLAVISSHTVAEIADLFS